jgi:hypothetical protein
MVEGPGRTGRRMPRPRLPDTKTTERAKTGEGAKTRALPIIAIGRLSKVWQEELSPILR